MFWKVLFLPFLEGGQLTSLLVALKGTIPYFFLLKVVQVLAIPSLLWKEIMFLFQRLKIIKSFYFWNKPGFGTLTVKCFESSSFTCSVFSPKLLCKSGIVLYYVMLWVMNVKKLYVEPYPALWQVYILQWLVGICMCAW